MPGTTAASARVSAWLNAMSRGEVSLTDAANACEAATGALTVDAAPWLDVIRPWVGLRFRPALIAPGRPSGVPLTEATDAVACGESVLLALTDEWHVMPVEHTVPVMDRSHARRALLAEVAASLPVLEGLATIGDRATADDLISASDGVWPPGLSARDRGDLELARRIRAAVVAARLAASVPSSRSQEASLHAVLRRLDDAALDLMSAAAAA